MIKSAFCRRCTPSSTRARTEVEEAAAEVALDQVFRRAAAAVATADRWADSPTSQRRKDKEDFSKNKSIAQPLIIW